VKKNSKSKKTHAQAPTHPPVKPTAGTGPMNVSLLEQLVTLMSVNQLTTVELKDGDQSILLKRGGEAPAGVVYTTAPAPQAPAAATVSSSAPALPPAGKPVDDTAGLVAIKSPMVGTFYAASSPEAKPFVSVGTSVSDDTDVCIIEAMKVFNNIKAETKGTIAKVLVTSGQTVEFGQTLFLVKP
jgi:acetyl-CoA carboxylase biotin carboxyl carrier protein